MTQPFVATLRRAAAASFVLASNDDRMLPLDRAGLRRMAVIGPNAAVARTMGGGSATVFPPYTVSPLEGLSAALEPSAEVDHSVGVVAGERVTATVRVKPRAFEHWDVDEGQGVVEPGAFVLSAGRSSALLPLSTEIIISGSVR